MIYRHSFQVKAPLDAVRRFHAQSSSMGAITPPPVIVRIHHAPEILQESDSMDFTLWLGPLPVRWMAQIENITPTGFDDRQLRGPFKSWVHRHRFENKNGGSTIVKDEVEAELSAHPFWRLIGAIMWANMPILFAYRAWMTRRQIEK